MSKTIKEGSFNLEANEFGPKQIHDILRRVFSKGGHPMPVCLCSRPGVGKSSIVKQVCAEYGVGDNEYHEIRASMVVDSSDLTGLPCVMKKMRTNTRGSEEFDPTTIYSRPEQLPVDHEGLSESERNKLHVIFFDEINRSSDPSIMNAIFQVTTEWKIGAHKLLPNVIILLALNPEAEGYLVNSMDPALINRLCFLFMNTSFADWKDYAEKKGVNPAIIEFLDTHRSMLSHDGVIRNDGADKRFYSPRAWENVSRMIDTLGLDLSSDDKQEQDLNYKVIAGIVGEQASIDFCTFTRTSCNSRPYTGAEVAEKYLTSVSMQKNVRATDSKGVRKYDATKVQQTLAGITDILRKEQSNIRLEQLKNILAFMVDIPVEQSMSFQNLLTTDINAQFTNWFFTTLAENNSLGALWKALQDNTKQYASTRKATSL